MELHVVAMQLAQATPFFTFECVFVTCGCVFVCYMLAVVYAVSGTAGGRSSQMCVCCLSGSQAEL